MKRIIQTILLGVLFISCTEISYKEPQPVGIRSLDEVPKKLHGSYTISENGETDTLTVLSSGYRIDNEDQVSLSDSVVLKYYKGYYFINTRENFAWYLRIVKQTKNKDLLYLAMDAIPAHDNDRKLFLDKLSAEITVYESTVDDKTYYTIDPTPQKLMELIRKGHFKDQTFHRIQ